MLNPIIKEFTRHLPDLKILVFGDLMLDEYLWGRTERISPEAPVQIVEVEKEELRLGGAGNVIHNLASLGCEVHVAGIVGENQDGRTLLDMLKKMQVNCDALFQVADRITSRKTRVLASRQQMIRIDRETRNSIDPVHSRSSGDDSQIFEIPTDHDVSSRKWFEALRGAFYRLTVSVETEHPAMIWHI